MNLAMKTIRESEKLSLAECRKLLNVNGVNYTDEEILKIRNWMYRFTEISLSFLEKSTNEEVIELKKLFGKKGVEK